MKSKLINFIQIYLADIFLLTASIICCIVYYGPGELQFVKDLVATGAIQVLCFYIFFMLFRCNRFLWRYFMPIDNLRLMMAYFFATIVTIIVTEYIVDLNVAKWYIVSPMVIGLFYSVFMRTAVSLLYKTQKNKAKDRVTEKYERTEPKNIIILGAGSAAISLLEEIKRNPKSPYSVKAMLDDDEFKVNRTILGVPIRGKIDTLPLILEEYKNAEVVLAIPSLGIERRKEIFQMANSLPCKFKIMPDTLMMLQNEGYVASVRNVKIDDLLGRTTVNFKKNELDSIIKGKTVLVTGGAGSIGSEICRQVAKMGVKNLVIFEMNEKIGRAHV